MLEQLQTTLLQAVPDYRIIYEEKHLVNIEADELALTTSFAYIEEFIRGQYILERFRRVRTMHMQVYFGKFTEIDTTATGREQLRKQIEEEAVLPFIDCYESSGVFAEVRNWELFYPLPRWDASEVSILLQFACRIVTC